MRYIILDPEHGVFLGTHTSRAFDESGSVLSLWSRRNIFNLTRAYSFDTKTDAYLYLEHYLLDNFPGAFVTTINSEEKYVDVVDLLKCGLEQFTFDMIDGLHMPSESLH